MWKRSVCSPEKPAKSKRCRLKYDKDLEDAAEDISFHLKNPFVAVEKVPLIW